MFDRIAGRYDLLNALLSGGRDRAWRRALTRAVAARNPRTGLDLCCGTGAVALELARGLEGGCRVVAADFSSRMCAAAAAKFSRSKFALSTCCADGLVLPFRAGQFDFVSVAFGVRNFEDLARGLGEIARVLRPGGTVAILEFAPPEGRFLRALYKPYLRIAVPAAGRLLSADSGAYSYLSSSIQSFLPPARITASLHEAGFREPSAKKLTFGVTYLYTATR